MPAALAFIMFALGLTLTPDDFRRVLGRPKAIAAGLAGQLVMVPALGWAIATVWGLPGEMAVGLMIVAACALRVRVTALNRVDFPTLGRPTIPAESMG